MVYPYRVVELVIKGLNRGEVDRALGLVELKDGCRGRGWLRFTSHLLDERFVLVWAEEGRGMGWYGMVEL